jgi:hypothetical protein
VHPPREFQFKRDIWTFQKFGESDFALKQLNGVFESKANKHLNDSLKELSEYI